MSSTNIDNFNSSDGVTTSYVSPTASKSIMEALSMFLGLGLFFIFLSALLTFGSYYVLYEFFKFLFAK